MVAVEVGAEGGRDPEGGCYCRGGGRISYSDSCNSIGCSVVGLLSAAEWKLNDAGRRTQRDPFPHILPPVTAWRWKRCHPTAAPGRQVPVTGGSSCAMCPTSHDCSSSRSPSSIRCCRRRRRLGIELRNNTIALRIPLCTLANIQSLFSSYLPIHVHVDRTAPHRTVPLRKRRHHGTVPPSRPRRRNESLMTES